MDRIINDQAKHPTRCIIPFLALPLKLHRGTTEYLIEEERIISILEQLPRVEFRRRTAGAGPAVSLQCSAKPEILLALTIVAVEIGVPSKPLRTRLWSC